MALITLTTFDNPIEAHIIKSKLESEGIVCYLFDENMVGLNPLYNVTVGGIKLKINEQDVERAAEVIETSNKAVVTDEAGDQIKCPACGSSEMYNGFKSMKGTKGILSAMVSLLFFVFPIYFKTVHKCKSCGHEFE